MAVATFDFTNLRIILPSGDVTIEVERDLYSAWKRAALVGDNTKFPPAFRASVGGDPLSPGIDAGAYFFLQNQDGWRIRPAEASATVTLTGNIIAEDSSLPLTVPTLGTFTVLINGIQPITQNVSSLLTLQQDSEYNGAVWFDPIVGSSGTDFPVGTAAEPSDNATDAFSIADTLGVSRFDIASGTLLVPSGRPATRHEFVGHGGIAGVNMNDQDLTGSQFSKVVITGDLSFNSGPVRVEDAVLNGAILSELLGIYADCNLIGILTLQAGVNNFQHCNTGPIAATLDMQGNASTVILAGYDGDVTLTNCTNAGSLLCYFGKGNVILDATCTAGSTILRGVGSLTDNSGVGMTVDKTGFVDGLDVKLIKALDSGNITITGSSPFVITVTDPDDGVTVLGTWEVTADGRTRTRTS